MSVTYEGPIRVRRRPAPSNDGTSPLLDNTGVVSVAQTLPFSSNIVVPFALPAGSLLLRAFAYYTTATADPAATITFTLATTPAISITSAALGAGNRRVDISFATLGANAANTGLSPVSGTFTDTSGVGPQSGVYVIEYLVRNADGSIIPYGSGLTNDGTNSPSF